MKAFDIVIDGKYGRSFATDHIYDEAVTLTLSRTGSFDYAKEVGRRIRGAGGFPKLLALEHIDPLLFQSAVDIFERYDDQRLSFTDATTIALLRERNFDFVLSFDDDFDGIVDRLDPADLG